MLRHLLALEKKNFDVFVSIFFSYDFFKDQVNFFRDLDSTSFKQSQDLKVT